MNIDMLIDIVVTLAQIGALGFIAWGAYLALPTRRAPRSTPSVTPSGFRPISSR